MPDLKRRATRQGRGVRQARHVGIYYVKALPRTRCVVLAHWSDLGLIRQRKGVDAGWGGWSAFRGGKTISPLILTPGLWSRTTVTIQARQAPKNREAPSIYAVFLQEVQALRPCSKLPRHRRQQYRGSARQPTVSSWLWPSFIGCRSAKDLSFGRTHLANMLSPHGVKLALAKLALAKLALAKLPG